MIADAAAGVLEDGDILVVTSKIVSKAEGRMIAADDREDAITAETVRVVATRATPNGGTTRIVQNRLGIVSAAAGVDASNTPEGTVLLLPVDPDASARALASGLRSLLGVEVGVIVSDTLGPRVARGPDRLRHRRRAACTSSRTCAAGPTPRVVRSWSRCPASPTRSRQPPTS